MQQKNIYEFTTIIVDGEEGGFYMYMYSNQILAIVSSTKIGKFQISTLPR